MGSNSHEMMGYGIVLLAKDNNPNDWIYNLSPPAGIADFYVGDLGLGEQMGILYFIKDAEVTVNLSSIKTENEYIIEYGNFTVTNVDPALEQWLRDLKTRKGLVYKFGLFKVYYYG